MSPVKVFTHTLAFDTNVFRKIIRAGNEKHFENLFLCLNKIVNAKNEYTGYLSTVTPFLILEYLGQVPPNIQIPDPTREDIERFGKELPEEIVRRAEASYRQDPGLAEASLRTKNVENLKYLSPAPTAKKLYEDIVGRIVDKNGFSNRIIFNLAMDYAYRFPFRNFLNGNDLHRIHLNTMLDIYRAHAKLLNLTQMRGVLKLCEELERQNAGGFNEDAKAVLTATKGVKEFRDLADLDFVQLSCLGAFVGNDKYPVLILTSDPKDVTLNRIRLFKSTFEYFDNAIKSNEALLKAAGLNPVALSQGLIAFVKLDDCSVVDFVEVSTVKPAA